MGKTPKIENLAELNDDTLNELFFNVLAGHETPKSLIEHLNHSQSRYNTNAEEFALDYDRLRVVQYKILTTSETWESEDLGKSLFPTLN